MTTAISRNVPPQKLINIINPVVRAIAGSALHGTVDSALLVLHIVGRRSGRRYDIPVGYVDVDGQRIVVTQHLWRVNLRDATDVEVTYRGRRGAMRVELDENPATVAETLLRIIERVGWKAASRTVGLKVTVGRTPTVAELEAATREFHLATVTLTDR
ncbi:nitroreductase/quinone reductase family protein [Nakamurella sp. GG22]